MSFDTAGRRAAAVESGDAFLTLGMQWLTEFEPAGVPIPGPIQRLPDFDRGFSRHADPEEIDRARTRRLVAKLFRIVRPTLAFQPRRHENTALDAVARTAALILARTEDRDALDFFILALTQNLNRVEARDSDGSAGKVSSPVPPETSGSLRPFPPEGEKTTPHSSKPLQDDRSDAST